MLTGSFAANFYAVPRMTRDIDPLERLKMGSSMFETSKRLVSRAILEDNPTISKLEFKRDLFLKFYGNDFNPVDRDKILSHLERCA